MPDLDLAAIMKRHAKHRSGYGDTCVVTVNGPIPEQDPCQVYRLAAELAAVSSHADA